MNERERQPLPAEAHRAFGLTIAADFALPGMVPAEHGPSDVTIHLGTREDVEAAWAGREPAGSWRSVLGDGQVFSGQQAADGAYRLAYGQAAVFFISADAGTVVCGPEAPHDATWQRVLLDTVFMVASVAAGFEVLHAGAVETPAGVVAVVAESGGGKSSLVAELVRRGHALFSDDIVVLERGPNGARSHPGPPVMNVPCAPERFPIAQIGSVLATFGDEAWIAVRHVVQGVRRLAAVCLLDRGTDTTRVQRLASSPVHLHAHVYPRLVTRQRQRERFFLLADLAETVPIYRLCAGPEVRPQEIADMVESMLGTSLSHDAADGAS